MSRIRSVSDIEECEALWKRLMPTELVSDLWEVRECFHRNYGHRPRFVVAEGNGECIGFLPLSWNAETGQYNYFPGETWEGKTWLEQNRIIARDRETLDAMVSSLRAPYQLRYLRYDESWSALDERVDEVGYLFVPEHHGYSIDRYLENFSHKTAKKLRKELNRWEDRTVEWRYDDPADFETLCEMNLSRYGRLSYFHDRRFLESFRSLTRLLAERGWLRVVTVTVDGIPAAVDLGSLYCGMLTMLAGGTNADFPGIAKLINMKHMTYACDHKLDSVDFLCGDFNWKTLFHLKPVSLFVLEGDTRPATLVEESAISLARPQISPAEIGSASYA